MMHCTGLGSAGQLGISGVTTDKDAPAGATVPWAVSRGWATVSAGQYHTCGIALVTRALFCWGAHKSVVDIIVNPKLMVALICFDLINSLTPNVPIRMPRRFW